MNIFKVLQIDFAHNVGKIIEDKKLKRKKHDIEYKERTRKVECTFRNQDYQKLSRQAQKAGFPASTYLKETYFKPCFSIHL